MQGDRAVVLGGSIAGMCAAGVLARHFDEVVVLERDDLPVDAEHRRGVPQSKHPHFLLNMGRRAMGEIFEGFEKSLLAAGGQLLMPSLDAAYCEQDGWAPRKQGSMTMIYSSRVLVERVVRDHVHALAGVEVREGVAVRGLIAENGGSEDGRVTGVEYADADGTVQTMGADLVVDALGRGSSVAAWLTSAGWQAPQEKTLDAKVTYTSRWYELPAERERPEDWWWRHVVVTPVIGGDGPVEHEWLSNFFPIEGDRAIACMGSWGHDMPRSEADFEASAARVRTPEFVRAMELSTPTTSVASTRATGNKWRRYDLAECPAVGIVSVGDAICAFNPFYGQGMSSAARTAVILGQALGEAESVDGCFTRAFLDAQREFLEVPWQLAMARDSAYDFAEGTETVAPWRRKLVAFTSWPIFNAINAAAREDAYVERSFAEIFNLEKPLSAMLRSPRFWFGLGRYRVRAMLGRTVVPAGFDKDQPPPGFDFTGYEGGPIDGAAGVSTSSTDGVGSTDVKVTA